MKQKSIKALKYLMLLAALLANIKNIFVDYNSDSGYAIATAQRLIDGDGLFFHMWEPHQTSSFVIAGFMKVYETVFHTKDGIVFFLNGFGFVLYALTAMALYAVMKNFVDKNAAFLMMILILVLRPKLVQIPDYANLVIIFSVWLFIFLIRYILCGYKLPDLIAASLFLLFDALSYPSCIVLAIGMIICLAIFSEKKFRDILISMGICAICGCAVLFLPIRNLGAAGFFNRIFEIVKGDSHSAGRVYGGINYFIELFIGAIILLGCVLVSFIIKKVMDAVGAIVKAHYADILSIVITIVFCIESLIISSIFKVSNMAIWCIDKILIVAVIVIGLFFFKELSEKQKCIYIVSMIIAGGTLIGVSVLTNLPLITVFCYAHLAVTASVMTLSEHRKVKAGENKETIPISRLSIACVLIFLFVQGTWNLKTVENYVRTGPLKWMVTTLEKCNYYRVTDEEWRENVKETDYVLLADEYGFDPINYILTDAKVSINSTISTPTFGEMLKKYWTTYPDREPSVIAVPCWEGKDTSIIPEWLRLKIQNEYEQASVGECWIFYRKK